MEAIMPKVNYHMANGKVVLGDPPERILDYHNNDLVADLHHLIAFFDEPGVLTDWEYLCAVAKIVDKRRPPSSNMIDCQTGLSYEIRGKQMFDEALAVAKRNAGL